MTTTRDITRDDLIHPGDVLGGAMVEGWTGPAMERSGRAAEIVAIINGEGCGESLGEPGLWSGFDPCEARLDFTRPEVRDRARRVLARGIHCPADPEGEGHLGQTPHDVCRVCGGAGIVRHRLGWITDAEEAGTISPEVAAALCWCSVARVDVGLAPIAGIGPAAPHLPTLDRVRRESSRCALVGDNFILLPLGNDVVARLAVTP